MNRIGFSGSILIIPSLGKFRTLETNLLSSEKLRALGYFYTLLSFLSPLCYLARKPLNSRFRHWHVPEANFFKRSSLENLLTTRDFLPFLCLEQSSSSHVTEGHYHIEASPQVAQSSNSLHQ